MDKLTRPVQVLLTVGEADRLLALAKRDGRTISAWCRRVLVRELWCSDSTAQKLLAAAPVSLDATPAPDVGIGPAQAPRRPVQPTSPATAYTDTASAGPPHVRTTDRASMGTAAPLDSSSMMRAFDEPRCAPHKRLLPCSRCLP